MNIHKNGVGYPYHESKASKFMWVAMAWASLPDSKKEASGRHRRKVGNPGWRKHEKTASIHPGNTLLHLTTGVTIICYNIVNKVRNPIVFAL